MKIVQPFLFSSLLTVFFASTVFPIANCAADDSAGTVPLPPPVKDGKASLEKVLHERRSVRQYKNLSLALSDLSQLLWAAQGISGTGGKRTAPSAGALYPLEVFVVAGNVDGLSAGVYQYNPHQHTLGLIAEGDARQELAKAALGQSAIKSAPAVLVIAAVYDRTTGKYGERGIRYVHMEAGHAAQNVSLQAVSLGLGTVVIGAFHDGQVRLVLHLPAQQQPLSIIPIGMR